MNDRQFNTEMQNDISSDHIPKRARYYQGLLDTPILKSGKKSRYRQLPSSFIIFITQDDIFKRDLAMYTFTEQCEETADLHLGDGTAKIFLNMTSKNGRPDLVSLLQYMKDTRLDNPEISVCDPRIKKLAEIVDEVKQSEEWEAVKMSILSIGIQHGEKIGLERGMKRGMERGIERGMERGMERAVLSLLEDLGEIPEDLRKRITEQKDLEILNSWIKKAAKAKTVEDFANEISAPN